MRCQRCGSGPTFYLRVQGRAGYGGSLDGMVSRLTCISTFVQLAEVVCQWPYSYDSCDVGTLPNQTYPGTSTPLAALKNGDPGNDGVLVCRPPLSWSELTIHCQWQSYLPGQRLCTFVGFDRLGCSDCA